jgi:hypothetical protein
MPTVTEQPKRIYHHDVEILLSKYSAVFGSIPPRIPPNRGMEHVIELKEGSKLVITTPYRHPKRHNNEIEKAIKKLIDMGHIRPCKNPFTSFVVLVKKDGLMHMCIDYRALNKKTIKNRYPIPRIDELIDELHGACYFSKIDLKLGYHQIQVTEEDVEKTAFKCHYGHFEFLEITFGLDNAPTTFQSYINKVFRNQLRKYVLILFYDILVFRKS